MPNSKKLKTGNKSLELSHLNKIFYPDRKYTKGDIINYYNKIADYMLPHVKDRLLVMQRFPDGIKKMGFYQKEIPDYFPSWIKSKKVNLKKKGSRHFVVIEKGADMIYLADQGTLVFHIWLSKKDKIKNPDKMIFDLDPPKEKDFSSVKFAAYKIKHFFEKMKFNVFVMTTGSKGLHVVIPIKPNYEFDKVHEFTQKIAKKLANKYPDRLTTEIRKNKRQGRIFLDYLRNSFGQTGVAPYSLRAIENAPIATPLDWSELSSIKDAQKYNIANIFKRLAQKDDPWKNIYKKANNLKLD